MDDVPPVRRAHRVRTDCQGLHPAGRSSDRRLRHRAVRLGVHVQETRKRFHDELDALESEILGLGERAELAISRAVTGLVRKDRRLTEQVIAEDDAIDATYMDVERRILSLLAAQTPVASDLRLVSGIMHINLHLARMGYM